MNILPASGSILDYRFTQHHKYSGIRLRIMEHRLFTSNTAQAKSMMPVSEYCGYEHIGSGWEWSVFRKSESLVIKIPAGIFDEVGKKEYLDNCLYNYNLLAAELPESTAESKFYVDGNGQNIIEQKYLNRNKVSFNFKSDYEDLQYKSNTIIKFCRSCILFLERHDWLPDLNPKISSKDFTIGNCFFDEYSDNILIFDFTSYFDVYRLYPSRMERAKSEKRKIFLKIISALEDI